MVNGLLHWIRCTRYNHALEHATLHLLQRRYPSATMMGFSDGHGITFYSQLSAEEILPALHEAQMQLRNGASGLAVHPHCGTNLVVAALLTTLASWLGLASSTRQSRLDRFSRVMMFNLVVLYAAPSIGNWTQAHLTTDAALPEVAISSLFADEWGKLRRVRVNLRYKV